MKHFLTADDEDIVETQPKKRRKLNAHAHKNVTGKEENDCGKKTIDSIIYDCNIIVELNSHATVNVIWKPSIQLSSKTENSLYQKMQNYFNVKKHGFGVISNDEIGIFLETIRNWKLFNQEKSNENDKIEINSKSDICNFDIYHGSINMLIRCLHSCYLRILSYQSEQKFRQFAKKGKSKYKNNRNDNNGLNHNAQNHSNYHNNYNNNDYSFNNYYFPNYNNQFAMPAQPIPFVQSMPISMPMATMPILTQCDNKSEWDLFVENDTLSRARAIEIGKKHMIPPAFLVKKWLECNKSFIKNINKITNRKSNQVSNKDINKFLNGLCDIPMKNYPLWLEMINCENTRKHKNENENSNDNDNDNDNGKTNKFKMNEINNSQSKVHKSFSNKYGINSESCENIVIINCFDDSVFGYKFINTRSDNADTIESKTAIHIESILQIIQKMIEKNNDKNSNNDDSCKNTIQIMTENELRKFANNNRNSTKKSNKNKNNNNSNDCENKFIDFCNENQLNPIWQTSNAFEKFFKLIKNGDSCPTPDILFSNEITINGMKINWIDCKNYYVSTKDWILNSKMKKQITKYNTIWGKGAIICNGYQSELTQIYNQKCLFLDSSHWCLSLPQDDSTF